MYCMKIRKYLAATALAVFACLLALDPQTYSRECYAAMCMWAESVVPSLFPFMVITSLLGGMGFARRAGAPLAPLCRRLKLPPSAPPLFVLSWLSGYPAGSRCVAEHMSNSGANADDAKKLAALCSTSGPLFIVGTVGTRAFGDPAKGGLLLAVCTFSVIICVIFYCALSSPSKSTPYSLPAKNRGNALADSFYGAVSAVLLAGAFIVFFYTLGAAMDNLKLFAPATALLGSFIGEDCAAALCRGCVEATGGIFALAAGGGTFALPLAGFLITFGGASILAQQMAFLQKCGVSARFFVSFKFVQALLSFALVCALQPLV